MSVQFIPLEVQPAADSVAPDSVAADAALPDDKPKRVRANGGAKPLPVTLISLDQPGRLRVGHLLTYLQVTSTTLYDRINAGTIPKPDGHDGRPFWLTSTIKSYLAGGVQ